MYIYIYRVTRRGTVISHPTLQALAIGWSSGFRISVDHLGKEVCHPFTVAPSACYFRSWEFSSLDLRLRRRGCEAGAGPKGCRWSARYNACVWSSADYVCPALISFHGKATVISHPTLQALAIGWSSGFRISVDHLGKEVCRPFTVAPQACSLWALGVVFGRGSFVIKAFFSDGGVVV